MKHAPPWATIGVKIENTLTETLANELAWRIDKAPVFCDLGDTKLVLKDRVALVRSDTREVLSIVPSDWLANSHIETFQVFTENLKEQHKKSRTEAAGAIAGGKTMWLLSSLGATVEHIQDHLLFSVPYQYGHSPDIRYVALHESGATWVVPLDVPFRRGMDISKFVEQSLVQANIQSAEVRKNAAVMMQRKCSLKEMEKYVAEIFKGVGATPSRSTQAALEVFQASKTQTWWDAFMAVAFAMDHLLGYSEDTRVASTWYGVNCNRKIKAAEFALKKAKKG